jgi:hypothetical protein
VGAFCFQQVGQEVLVGGPFPQGVLGQVLEAGADRGQVQDPAGVVDDGLDGYLAEASGRWAGRRWPVTLVAVLMRDLSVGGGSATGRRRPPTAAGGCRLVVGVCGR